MRVALMAALTASMLVMPVVAASDASANQRWIKKTLKLAKKCQKLNIPQSSCTVSAVKARK